MLWPSPPQEPETPRLNHQEDPHRMASWHRRSTARSARHKSPALFYVWFQSRAANAPRVLVSSPLPLERTNKRTCRRQTGAYVVMSMLISFHYCLYEGSVCRNNAGWRKPMKPRWRGTACGATMSYRLVAVMDVRTLETIVATVSHCRSDVFRRSSGRPCVRFFYPCGSQEAFVRLFCDRRVRPITCSRRRTLCLPSYRARRAER